MLREPNAALWWVVAGTAIFLALALLVPGLRAVFHFDTPSTTAAALGICAGLATVPWLEALRALRRRAHAQWPACW